MNDAHPVVPSSSGIYQIRCLVHGKIYIGSAVNLSNRWRQHRQAMERGDHYNLRLQNSWNKHGSENFVFEILELVDDKASLVIIEQGYLDRLRPFDVGVGYNNSPTAGSMLGYKYNEEAKAKMSEHAKAQWNDPESRAILLEARANPEAVKKMSDAMKCLWNTQEWRDRIVVSLEKSKAQPSYQPNRLKGLRSKESRAAMSEAHRKRDLSIVQHKPAPNQMLMRFMEDDYEC